MYLSNVEAVMSKQTSPQGTSKESLSKALRNLKTTLVAGDVDVARFEAEANQFYMLIINHPTFTRTPVKACIDMFVSIFKSGLSWEPNRRQVSLMVNDEGTLAPFVHYQGQIRLASAKGIIERVTADLLYESDDFEFYGATEMPKIRRKLSRGGLGEAIGGYTISHLTNGSIHVESFDDVALAKAEEAGIQCGNSEFWTGPHRREMQRKSLINATARRWLELSYTMKSINQ